MHETCIVRNPVLRLERAARESAAVRVRGVDLAAYIRAFSARVGTPLASPVDTLALGLMSLCAGMQFFRMCDPQQVTGEAAEAVLAGFASRVLLRARQKRRSRALPRFRSTMTTDALSIETSLKHDNRFFAGALYL